MTRRAAWTGLALALVLAAAVRMLGVETVFVDDETVVFALGDAWYHARRALFSFEHWPRTLWFDPLLNHPAGAAVPWPPLYDLALAGAGKLAARDAAALERVVALAPVALGAATVLPVYAAGSRVGGRGVGLGAALLFAVWPATLHYSEVGNADHHAAQALCGALLLALSLRAVAPATRGRPLAATFAGLALARAALLLTWPGSVVYLVLCDGLLLAAAVLLGRTPLLLGEAASVAATALAVLPAVLRGATPVGGPFSAVELSWLHVLWLGLVALVALACAGLERVRPASGWSGRALRGAALALGLGAVALVASGALAELALGFGYVAKTDDYAGRNLEQYPLFRLEGGFSDALGREMLGLFAWGVPLVPLAALWQARDPELRAPALVLAGWAAGLGALALYQVRFANDWAPAGAVASALALALLARGALGTRRARLAAALAVCVAAVLLAPVLEALARRGVATARALSGQGPARDRALDTHQGTMRRFAEQVRRHTPETAGFDDPSAQPDYGILAWPGIGHVLHYAARRATPADNFGPYIGPAGYRAVGDFFRLKDESAALDEAERLGIRFVVTADYGGSDPTTLVNHLHRADGSALPGAPAFSRLRLVTEGPAGGRAPVELFGRRAPRPAIPYKLFEIVPGAVLEAEAEPGTPVSARLGLRSPLGRRFRWEARTTAGADGRARLRVPYATRGPHPTRALAPYRVEVGERAFAVPVPEAAVLEGATVAVGEAPS